MRGRGVMWALISMTDHPNVTVGRREPPTPTLLSHPHLSIPFSSPLLSPPLPSPHLPLPLSEEGGSADSYILGRSRGFLPMSKSLAGLCPQPDGQGQ